MKDRISGRSAAFLRQLVESQHRTLEAMLKLHDEGESQGRASQTIAIGPKLASVASAEAPTPRPLEPRVPGWPTARLPKKPLNPPPGWACFSLEGERVGAIAIPLFGLYGITLRTAVARIAAQQRQTMNFIPVFLTDSSDHAVFRRGGHVFEYFPKGIYGSADDVVPFQDKFAFTWRKWNIQSMIDLSAAGYLARRLPDGGLPQPSVVKEEGFVPERPVPAMARVLPPDIAAQKAEYFSKGLDGEPDDFVLYRVIGNDLYPRHEKGQAVQNVRFILEHEAALERCEKCWIVNRIVDPEQEAIILEMLERKGQRFIRIPFDWDAYRDVAWDLERFPQPGFFLRGPYNRMGPRRQLRADAQARRRKINFAMNNNGARNVALSDGRDRAKWVLPFDGNCFFTETAWREIVATVTDQPYLKYFVVPMARMTDNQVLFGPDFRPQPLDEPQILFRRDAAEMFDEAFAYGRRPKVELLWRLGVTGDWDNWYDDPWDLPRPARAGDAGNFGRAGWVARLFSGMAQLEASSKASLSGRELARNQAIVATLDYLDEEAMRRRFAPHALTAYDEAKIAALSRASERAGEWRRMADLTNEAAAALSRGPYSVVDKTSLPPSGDPHDYWHPAPYWWPNPATADGLPYLRRDGERRPGTGLYEPESEQFDRTRLQRMFDDTTVLALAWRATGERAYADHGAMLVRHWFLKPETRMNPHLRYAQVRPGHNAGEGSGFGIIEMKDLYFFLDAVRLLERSGAFNEDDRSAFAQWLKDYLDWLRESPQGLEERKAGNNHGTCHDLQVGAIAAYLGDIRLLLATFFTSRERLLEQFTGAGEQPQEAVRTMPAHYCSFNLQSWVNLATLAEGCGCSLWHFEGSDGRGLRRAFEWLVPVIASTERLGEEAEAFDRDRILPLIFACERVFGVVPAPVSQHFDVKPIFSPHDGIKPFWMLGRDLDIHDDGQCAQDQHKLPG